MGIDWHAYGDATALAAALAGRVAAALGAACARSGAASLALSGGTTPVRFLRALSGLPLDWPRVSVTLVDERWVGDSDPRSNARLVRDNLLRGAGASAKFVPLHDDAPTPEAALVRVAERLAAMPRPFAAVVLGMGNDGHTASWFPGGAALAQALAGDAPPLAAMRAPAAGEPRITLTLPAILDTGLLALHIEGQAKRAIFEQACGDGPTVDMPVRAVIRQERLPLEVFWCP